MSDTIHTSGEAWSMAFYCNLELFDGKGIQQNE